MAEGNQDTTSTEQEPAVSYQANHLNAVCASTLRSGWGRLSLFLTGWKVTHISDTGTGTAGILMMQSDGIWTHRRALLFLYQSARKLHTPTTGESVCSVSSLKMSNFWASNIETHTKRCYISLSGAHTVIQGQCVHTDSYCYQPAYSYMHNPALHTMRQQRDASTSLNSCPASYWNWYAHQQPQLYFLFLSFIHFDFILYIRIHWCRTCPLSLPNGYRINSLFLTSAYHQPILHNSSWDDTSNHSLPW
jgi:hypothetical protein